MISRRKVIVFFIPAVLLFLTGCLSFSSHSVGVEPNARYMDQAEYEVIGEAEGISSSFRLFWVFPVTPRETFDEAVDDTVKSKGGDNMIETVFTRESRVYIIGTVNIIHVKGKVIRYLQTNKKQK